MNKKALILAPSKSLINRKLGKIIDTYDVVCRINGNGNHEILNKKNKDIIGTKKNIWFCLEPTGFRRNKPSLIKQYYIVFTNHKKLYEDNN